MYQPLKNLIAALLCFQDVSPTSNCESRADKWWEGVSEATVLRQHANRWSLAGDSATAAVLNKISQQLMLRTEELSSKLDSLVQNVGDLATEVANTNNSFTMLSHTQFIENRTYLDDERAPLTETLPDAPTPHPDPPSSIYRRALLDGLEIFSACYQAHQLADSDQEEGDTPDSPTSIYTLRNPYAGRQLPHIIMSREFMVDPLVGLQPVPSDNNEEEEEEERREVMDPAVEEDGTSASDEDIGDANIFTKKFQATSSRIVEDDSDSDWSDSLDIEKLKRQRNELLQQQLASSTLPNGASDFPHPPPDDSTSTVSDSQVVRPQPAGRYSHPVAGRRSNTGPVHYSESDEEFFKPVAAPGHNTNLFGDPRQPTNVTAAAQQRLGQHRTAPSSSDSDGEGLFSSGVGRRRPPPLPGGSKHPSSSASSPATSLVPASDEVSTVVRSTNVENVRAFPDVNPIANRAGRGSLRPSSQALLKTQVPGARGLFSSDTEEDDLFGTNPPPLNKLSSDVQVSLGPSSVSTAAAVAGGTRAAKQQQPRGGGDLFGSDEDAGDDPTDTDVAASAQAAVEEIIPVTASGRRVPVGGVNIFSAAITAAIRKPSTDHPSEEEGPPSASATAPYLQQQRDLEQQHRLVQQQQQQRQQQRQKQQHQQLPSQRGAPKPEPAQNSGFPPSLPSDAVTPSGGASPYRGARTGGLGLFDDDDDDDGLFGSAPSPSAHREQHGGSSNFSGPTAGDGRSVGVSPGLTTPAPTTARHPPGSVPTAAVGQPTPPPAPASAAGGIFSSDDDDLFSSSSLITSANKKPSGGSVVEPSAKRLDKPVIAAKSNINEGKTNILPSSVAEPVAQKAVTLFEDSDDELFSPRVNAPVTNIKIASAPVPTIVSKTITSVSSEQSRGQAAPFGDDLPVKITKIPDVPVATPKTTINTPALVGNTSSSQLTVARTQSGGLFSSGSDEDLFGPSTFSDSRSSMSTISASQVTANASGSLAQASPLFPPKKVAMDQQQTSEPLASEGQEPSRPSEPAKPPTLEPAIDASVRPNFHTDHEKTLPIIRASSTTSSSEATDVGLPSIPVISMPISADQPFGKTDAGESRSGKPSEFIDSSSDEDLISPSPLALESVGTAAPGSSAFFASDSSEESFPSLANAIGYQRQDSAGTSAVAGGGLPASLTNKTLPPNRKRSNTKKVKFPDDAKQTKPAPKETKENVVRDNSISQSNTAALKNTHTSNGKAPVLPRQPDSDSDDLFADMPSVTGKKSGYISTSEKVPHGKPSGLFLSDDDDIFAPSSSSSSTFEKPLIAESLPTSDPALLLTGHKQRPVVPLFGTNDVEKKSSLTAEGDVIEDDIFNYISGEDMFDSGAKLSSSSIPSETQSSSAAGEPFPSSAGKENSYGVGHDEATTSVVDGNVHSSKNVPETPPLSATSGESGQSPLKKKPPVGGVALFGGSELLAKVGKRRQAVDSNEQPTKLQEDEAKNTLLNENDGAGAVINALKSDKPLPGTKPQVGMKPSVGFDGKSPVHVKIVPTEAKFSPGAEGSFDGSDLDESPIVSPRKKPVGGVSMFGGGGGAELLAKLKKRQDRLSGPGSDSEGTANTSADSTPSEEHKPFFPSPSTPNASLSTDVPRRPVMKNAPVSPVKKFLNTHGLSKGPSPASPPQVAKEEATSFETPTAVPVLNSLSKSRPKVGGQRRLPSRLSTKRRGPREDAVTASESDVEDGPSSPLASRLDGGKAPLQSRQTKTDEDLGVIDQIAPSPSESVLDGRQPEALPSQLSGLLSDALESSIGKISSSSLSNLLDKHEGSENFDSGLGSLKSETSSPKTYEKVDENSSKGSMIEQPLLVSKATSSDLTRTNSGLFSSSEDDSLFENTNSKTGLQNTKRSRGQIPAIEKGVSASSYSANVAGPTDLNESATRALDPPSPDSRSNGIQSYPGPPSNNPYKPLAATSTTILPAGGLFHKDSDSDSDGIFGSSISKVRTDSANSLGGIPSPQLVGGGVPVRVATPASIPHKDSVYNQAPRVPVTAARATPPIKSHPYLFGDVDDEDDLFGGGGGVGRAAVEQARPVVPSTPTVAAPSASRVPPAQTTPKDAGAFDDPLSDLLK